MSLDTSYRTQKNLRKKKSCSIKELISKVMGYCDSTVSLVSLDFRPFIKSVAISIKRVDKEKKSHIIIHSGSDNTIILVQYIR